MQTPEHEELAEGRADRASTKAEVTHTTGDGHERGEIQPDKRNEGRVCSD